MDDIETEGTGAISSVVRAVTLMCHIRINRTDDLAKILKAFIELNSRGINYSGKVL